MKKLLYILVVAVVCPIAAALLSACAGSGNDGQDTLQDSIDTTHIFPEAKEDSLVAQIKVPKAADGVFYDFFWTFCKKASYQKERVQYPLVRTINGKADLLEEGQWRFAQFNYNEDYHTVIYSGDKPKGLANDKNLTEVTVSWYDTNASQSKHLTFEKLEGQWMLTSLTELPLDQDTEGGFIKFLGSYFSSLEYRQSHTASRVEFHGYDSDDEFDRNKVKCIYSASEWDDNHVPAISAQMISNFNFGQDLSSTTERMLSVESVEGWSKMLYFRNEGGQWMLYKLVED